MLEQFHVKEQDAVRVGAEDLRATVAGIFSSLGVPGKDASLAADVLVTADLRGVESHGVSNMLSAYIRGYNSGEINPRPAWKMVRETPATGNIDCDAGLGIIVAPRAMDIAIDKARATGVGMITLHNGRHVGMASYHAMLALQHDMIGVCMTGCPPRVLPTFGAEARLGTNPIAVAAPAKDEPPFVYDAATSLVAFNKVDLALRLGVDLPPGWVGDDYGNPVMEAIAPSREQRLLPLGGTRESGSHKGYGLACVVDVLTGILSGTGYGMVPGRPNFTHMVAAYSIEAFSEVDRFKELMDDFLRTLRTTEPAPGHDRVLYAGLPEWEAERERREKGIPLHKEVVQWLQDICNEMGVPAFSVK